MSLVIGPRRVDAGSSAADESVPGALAPEGGLRSEQAGPEGRSHLVACRHCGTLNGRSATVCWGCEISLATRRRPKAQPVPEPESDSIETAEPFADEADASAAERNIADDTAQSPELAASPASGPDTEPGHLASAANDPSITQAAPAPMAPRRRWAMAGVASFVALAVAGAYLHFGAPPSTEGAAANVAPSRALRAEGIVAGAEPAADANAGRAVTAIGPTSRETAPPAVRAAPAATVQALFGDAGSVAGTEPDAAVHPAQPTGPTSRPLRADTSTAAALPEKQAGTSRRAARVAHASAGSMPPAPASETVAPAARAPTPAPAPGPCTAQVAALGLCSSSASPAKE